MATAKHEESGMTAATNPRTLPASPHQRRIPGLSQKRYPLALPPHMAGAIPGMCVDCAEIKAAKG